MNPSSTLLTSFRFQYVTLQLQRPLRRAKTDIQRVKALEDLPFGLNETYERALLSISIQERAQTIRALTWLVASFRPLKLHELAEASRVDLDASPILEEGTELDSPISLWEMLPAGFVMLDEKYEESHKNSVVAIAHSSFTDYLCSTAIQQSNSAVKEFFISQAAANAYVTEACIAYHIHASSKKEMTNVPDSDSSLPEDQEDNFINDLPFLNSWAAAQYLTEDKTVFRIFPLWNYAARYWMQHIENIAAISWSSTHRNLADSTIRPGSETFPDMIRVFDPDYNRGGVARKKA